MSARTVTPTETRTFWAHMDNYEPARTYFRGKLETHPRHGTDETTWVIQIPNPFEEKGEVGFLLDDGEKVIPCYVTGWGADGRVFLQPLPTNPGGKRIRPDNGEPIDYRGWALGPRKFYHLKIYD